MADADPERRPTELPASAGETVYGEPGALPLPADAEPAPIPDGVPFGRYRLLAQIGAGSMGVVFKAWDIGLNRPVALKQVKEEDLGGPRALERFLREARIAARLRHPGIVPVHDVGVAEGRHYLTMDFVPGRTFEEVLAESRDAKRAGTRTDGDRLAREVAVLAETAEAVAYANEQGVIHRDLKPGNVLVDPAGRAYVMDFGIAKQVSTTAEEVPHGHGSTLTLAGQLLGTPAYMSPEQARGDGPAIGPASDVWSLGAMLYEVLAGESPFEKAGGSWDIIAAVLHQDPAPPRRANRRAPEELEAVCLKALEKDPARRFAGAGALAAELRRWLRGEPVETRPPGIGLRAWRRLVRHRTWLAAASIAAAATLTALWFVRDAESLREEVLGHLRESARVWVEEALIARRRGDLEAARRFRPRLEEDCRRVRERLRLPSAEPEYHLGRLLRALREDGEALRCQEAALAVDPAFAPALYERAVLLARGFRERFDRSRRAALARRGSTMTASGFFDSGRRADEKVAEPTVEEVEREDRDLAEWRERTLKALNRLGAVLAETPAWRNHPARLLRVGEAQVAVVEGMLATFADGDAWEGARTRLESAIAADARLEEAYEALWLAATRAKKWREAIDACTRGLAADGGYLPHWLNRGSAGLSLGDDLHDRGQNPWDILGSAEADYGRALELEPGNVEARLGRGRVRASLAVRREQQGETSDDLLAAAEEDFGAATTADPDRQEAWMRLGSVRTTRALFRTQRGEDPQALFASAEADLARAIELPPHDSPDPWACRAALGSTWGNWLVARGRDARSRFEAAVADLGKALELNPARASGWRNRAIVRVAWGNACQGRGEDPAGHYLAAVADLEQSLRIDPASAEGWKDLGTTHSNRATALVARDQPAGEVFDAAIAAYGHALEINPLLAEAWMGRGSAHLNRALLRKEEDEVAERDYRAAFADLARALELNPASSQAWIARGMAGVGLGLQRDRHGEDPGEAYRAAIADFDQALARNPEEAEAYRGRGIARLHWIDWFEQRGEVRVDLYEPALADFDETLRVNPAQPQVRKWRDDMRQAWEESRRPIALSLLAHARKVLAAGQRADARRFLTQGLSLLPPDAAAPADRPALREAHYDLACLLALDGEKDAAIGHLENAVRLGWDDADLLRTDPDLESLRADARWPALVESAAKSGR